jgi:hypothetical protein
MKNKYGLSRHIPADTKRLVRQACGYGCIICGAAIIEYEHIDPPFPEAKTHNPYNIGLLCPQCHAKVTRGFLSKQTAKEARLNPFCKQKGYANEFFDIGCNHPKLIFAGSTITRTSIPVMVEGVALIRIDRAEEEGGPFRLSGNFYNSQGALSLEIVENEWRARLANWDVEAVGGVITIRDNPRHISLQLRAVLPDGLEVERLDMFVRNWHIIGNKRELVVESPDGRQGTFSGCLSDGAEVGFMLGNPTRAST